MGSYSLRVECLQPTTLFADALDDRARFEAAWDRLAIRPNGWRAHRLLDDDGGLFLKGHAVPLRCDKQMWFRRWDVQREVRTLRRIDPQVLTVPEIVAWGVETRWGIPTRSFLVLRRIAGAVDFGTFVETCARGEGSSSPPKNGEQAGLVDQMDPEQASREVGRLIAHMHDLGLCHGDLAPRNILLSQGRGGPVATLIDVPRARWSRTRWGLSAARRKDLYRLTKATLRREPEPALVRATLGEIVGPDVDDVLERTRCIASIRHRYRRKARLYSWRWMGI